MTPAAGTRPVMGGAPGRRAGELFDYEAVGGSSHAPLGFPSVIAHPVSWVRWLVGGDAPHPGLPTGGSDPPPTNHARTALDSPGARRSRRPPSDPPRRPFVRPGSVTPRCRPPESSGLTRTAPSCSIGRPPRASALVTRRPVPGRLPAPGGRQRGRGRGPTRRWRPPRRRPPPGVAGQELVHLGRGGVDRSERVVPGPPIVRARHALVPAEVHRENRVGGHRKPPEREGRPPLTATPTACTDSFGGSGEGQPVGASAVSRAAPVGVPFRPAGADEVAGRMWTGPGRPEVSVGGASPPAPARSRNRGSGSWCRRR